MAQRYEARLRAYGCEMDIATFRDLLADTMNGMCRGWNDEELMHNPLEARLFCDTIRRAVRCDLPDELILRVLSGARKHCVA